MPVYTHRCLDCSKEAEQTYSIHDNPEILCDCGGKTQRVLVPAAFSLKGSGWYRDSYNLDPSAFRPKK